MNTLITVAATAGLVVSHVLVVLAIFRTPSTEAGWGGPGYMVPLPVLVYELVKCVRAKRAET